MRTLCKATSLLLVLSLLFCLLAACGGDSNSTPNANDTQTQAPANNDTPADNNDTPANNEGGSGDSADGKATVNITLVLEDGTEVPYELHVTDGATLRDALYEAELISEETYYNMFVDNIDGHIADALNDGVTWMPLDENGEQIMGTFDEITVSNGQTITLQYTVVPNFDD